MKLPPYWSIDKNELTSTNGRSAFQLRLSAPALLQGSCRIGITERVRTPPSQELVNQLTRIQTSLVRIISPSSQTNLIKPLAVQTGVGAYSFMRASFPAKPGQKPEVKWFVYGFVQPNDYFSVFFQFVLEDPNGAEAKTLMTMIESMAVKPKA